MKKSLQFYLGILFFSVLISVPLLIPYLHSGYFPTHDGEWAVVRLSDMFREVRDFQFPPRYSGNLNFGYGYPLFNFAYPFPYYLGVIIHSLGIGFVDTIKLLFALTIPISAFFMFLASKNIWKDSFSGIISSVLYLYFSYRLVDLFVRGSIGESFGFAIFPLILLCLSKSIENRKALKFSIIGAFGFGVLVLSHNIMAVLFSLSLLIFFIGNYFNKGKEIIKPFLIVMFFGFVLSAFFWIPALLEKKYISLSVIPIADRSLYFVSLKQFLFAPWGYGVPTDLISGFSYQLGWSFLVILGASICLFVYQILKKQKRGEEEILAITLFCGVIILSVFLFPISKTLWNLPLLSEINYPWTMLSQLGLLISLLAGYLVKFKYTKVIALAVVILALVHFVPLAKPESYINKGDDYYFTNDATTTSSNELMPLWVKSLPYQRPSEKVEIIDGNGGINGLSYNSKKLMFGFNGEKDSQIRINTIYYPGWQIFDNNKLVTPTYNNKYGVMDINLSKGEHAVVAKFSETKPRLAADLISLIGLFSLGALAIKSLNKKSL